MTTAGLHRFSMTGSALCAGLGVLDGSLALRTAALVFLAAVAVGAVRFPSPPGKGKSWAVHGVTGLLVVFVVAVFWRNRVDAGVMLIMLGIVNRYLLRASARDDYLILGASTVLMAAATLITVGLLFPLLFVAFLAVSMWGMWTTVLIGTVEAHPTAPRAKQLRQKVPAGQLRMWGLSVLFSAAGFLVMALFPRYRFGRLLGAGYLASFGGAADQMTLDNDGATDARGGQAVLRVRPMGGGDSGSVAGLYARLYVLDRFDGRRWSGKQAAGRRVEGSGVSSGAAAVEVMLARQRAPGGLHPIAAVGRSAPSGWVSLPVRRSPAGTWLSTTPFTKEVRYRAGLTPAAARSLAPEESQQSLALPDIPEPIAALAAGLVSEDDVPGVRLEKILAHFSTKFVYSTRPPPGEASDPLLRFLFESRQGHCELFAGALTVLLRSAGIPARVATGFYGGYWNRVTGEQVFTGEDAHAWVEAYVDGRWRWVDATPPSGRGQRQVSAWAWLRDTVQAVEGLWYRYVVDFDGARRRDVATRLRGSWQGLRAFWASGGVEAGPAMGRVSGASLIVLALLLGGAGLSAALWIRGRGARRGRGLARLGRRLRHIGEGPRGAESYRPLSLLGGGLAPPIRCEYQLCVRRYERARFGPGDEASVAGLHASVRALEQRVRAEGRSDRSA